MTTVLNYSTISAGWSWKVALCCILLLYSSWNWASIVPARKISRICWPSIMHITLSRQTGTKTLEQILHNLKSFVGEDNSFPYPYFFLSHLEEKPSRKGHVGLPPVSYYLTWQTGGQRIASANSVICMYSSWKKREMNWDQNKTRRKGQSKMIESTIYFNLLRSPGLCPERS